MKKMILGLFMVACLPLGLFAQNEKGACVKSIRVSSQRGFDRVVFDLHGAIVPIENQTQDSHVEGAGALSTLGRYVSETTEYSGDPMRVRGTAFLELNWRGSNWTECHSTKRKVANLRAVSEVALYEDFEGHLGYYIGLKGKKRVKISTLSRPDRLVVDVMW